MGDSALSVNLLGQLVQVDVAKIGRVLVSAVLVGSLGLLSPIFPVILALATASLSLLVLGLVPFAIGRRNNRKNVWLSRLLVNLSKMTLCLVLLFQTMAKSTQSTKPRVRSL